RYKPFSTVMGSLKHVVSRSRQLDFLSLFLLLSKPSFTFWRSKEFTSVNLTVVALSGCLIRGF
ncbi:hypothetical protein ACUA1R_004227, partial [Enterobacter hormaechei]